MNEYERPSAVTSPIQHSADQATSAEQMQNHSATNQPVMTDSQVDSLLAMHGLQASQQRRSAQFPIKIIVAIAGLIILAIVVSIMLSNFKSGSATLSSGNDNNSLQSAGSVNSGDSTTKQINQDVHTCSNAVNAVSEC